MKIHIQLKSGHVIEATDRSWDRVVRGIAFSDPARYANDDLYVPLENILYIRRISDLSDSDDEHVRLHLQAANKLKRRKK